MPVVQQGVANHVTKNLNSLWYEAWKACRVVQRVFPRSVSVQLGARVLNLHLELPPGSIGGTLEH